MPTSALPSLPQSPQLPQLPLEKPIAEDHVSPITPIKSKQSCAGWMEEDISKIIKWLLTNKKKFRKSKTSSYKELSEYFDNRFTWKQVCEKISYLEKKYKKTCDARKGTGWGVFDDSTIAAKINKMCPYFDDLDKIFGKNPNINPEHVQTSKFSDTSSSSGSDPTLTMIPAKSQHQKKISPGEERIRSPRVKRALV